MTTVRLAVVGGGNMGAALVGGMLRAGWAPADLAVVEVVATRRDTLAGEFPGVRITAEIPACEAALIAVKPYDVVRAITDAVRAGASRILSIAGGVTLDTMTEAAGDAVVIRSMPNTPALVGEGVAAISAGVGATDADLEWAERILGAVGIVVRVPEEQLDAVTGLAGSGPAYLFLVAEALTDAGVHAGLSLDTSAALVSQLLVGAGALLRDRGNPAGLRTMVTSPGGTTAAGLRALESRAVRSAMIEAVLAATARSRELGH